MGVWSVLRLNTQRDIEAIALEIIACSSYDTYTNYSDDEYVTIQTSYYLVSAKRNLGYRPRVFAFFGVEANQHISFKLTRPKGAEFEDYYYWLLDAVVKWATQSDDYFYFEVYDSFAFARTELGIIVPPMHRWMKNPDDAPFPFTVKEGDIRIFSRD